MRINRVKNTKRNFLWGIVEKFVSIFLPFVLRTIFIEVLGEELLGLSSLFTSILQMLNMAELGFSSAVIYNMYKPIADNDTDTICALMNLYRKVYFVIGCIVLAVGLALMPFLPRVINGSIPHGYNLYLLYMIYLVNTSVSYFLFAYKNCLLNAYHRNDIISKVKTVTMAIQYTYQVVILLIAKNYYLYIIILPVITILDNIVNAVISTKMFPQYKCFGTLSKEKVGKIKLNVTGLMIGKICVVSRNSLDSIFLSAFINLSTVAIYGNYYYILTAINTFLAVITNSMSAGVGNSIAVEKKEKNYSDFRMFNFLYAWIAGWCTVCLLCLYQPFMMIWMGKDLMFPFFTVILFCVYFYSLKLGDIRSIYSSAAGLFWQSRYYVIAEAAANAVLNYLFVKRWGVNGIIVATNVTIILINFLWGTRILFHYYFTESNFTRYIAEQVGYAAVTIINCVVMVFLCNRIDIKGFPEIIVKGALCVLVPNVFYYLAYRKHELFIPSINLLKRTIRKSQ